MNEGIFINIALDTAMKRYVYVKQFNLTSNDFLVYVINMLSYIYGEEIINCYQNHNDNSKLSFEKTILKYGLDNYYISKFYQDLSMFYEQDIRDRSNGVEKKNEHFMYVQEDLIEMFISKVKNCKLSNDKLKEFAYLLYSSKSNNEYKRQYNQKKAPIENHVLNYYSSRLFSINHVVDFKEIKQNLLSYDIYKEFGINKSDLDNLASDDVYKINARILNYYKMNAIDPKLNNKLLFAIQKQKKRKNIIEFGFIRISVLMAIIIMLIVIAALIGIKLMGAF